MSIDPLTDVLGSTWVDEEVAMHNDNKRCVHSHHTTSPYDRVTSPSSHFMSACQVMGGRSGATHL